VIAAPGDVATVRFEHCGWEIDAAVLAPGAPGPEQERDAILAATADHLDPSVFPAVVRAVKAWAEARQIDDPAFGFPGGLAWTIAAAAARPDRGADAAAWLKGALERLLDPDPIGLGSEPFPADVEGDGAISGFPAIWTAAPPRQRVARHLQPATAAIVQGELERAVLCAWDRDWVQLFSPIVAPEPEPGARALRVELGAADPAARDAALGWLRGRACALTAALAAASPSGRVRPWPRPEVRRAALRVSWTVPGAGAADAALREVAESLRDRWAHAGDRPPGDIELRVIVDRIG
jgi:hypothetical protein